MNVRNQKRRPWFKILRDLMKAGISMHQVARNCARDVKTVFHWAEGGDPKDLESRIVLALYRRHCPDQYKAHMEEFHPDALVMWGTTVLVKADSSLRGRPKPKQVPVMRTETRQPDLFGELV